LLAVDARLSREEKRFEDEMTDLTSTTKIVVREVGPRDGLQMAKAIMPTAAKLRWIAAMVAAGVQEMEVASFVPPTHWAMQVRARSVASCGK
jgi:isopropylmalate/homocitrate/citramalate synthase